MTIDRQLDPEMAPLFAMLGLADRPLFDLADLDAARATMRHLAQAGLDAAPARDGIETVERIVPGGRPDEWVRLRITRPTDGGSAMPALLWFHGGGMLLGSAADDDPLAARLAATIGCAVVAVEYRLAPEHPFPAALDDGHAAYGWLAEHATQEGIAPDRIAIGGFSAGAGLAASVALRLRDGGSPSPLFLSLTAPMLDDRQDSPSSRETCAMGVWDRAANIAAWNAYLGPKDTAEAPYAVPARALDLSRLPPTFMAIGEIDLFRDEAMAFVQRLVAAGVPTEFHLYPGACHGFDGLNPEASVSRSFSASWLSYLERMFARGA